MITLIERLSLLAAMVAAALLGIAIILVCQMVYLRYILGASAPWQTEAVTVSLVAATLLGSAYVLKERGHVAVGLVTEHMPDPVQRGMLIISDTLVFLFSVLMTWKSFELTWEAFEGGWTTDTTPEFPQWWTYVAMPVGFGLLALQCLACILRTRRGDPLTVSGGH